MGLNTVLKARHRIKEEYSRNPGTARTRAYERSRAGLDAAALRLGRNRRAALSRARKKAHNDPLWPTLSAAEQECRERVLRENIDRKYAEKEAEVMEKWNAPLDADSDTSGDPNATTSDIGIQQDDEDKGSESIRSDEDDVSDDQFDENIDEPHPLDKRDNEGKLQVSEEVKKDFGEIIRRRAGDMKRAMRPFRLWSSQSDEEQIESESEGREQNSVNE